jgi:hypothetical protein
MAYRRAFRTILGLMGTFLLTFGLILTNTSVANAAGSASQSNVAAAAVPSCEDFWRHSGHTDRVRWYHCHGTSDPYVKRVHICGVSGTLHGITVGYLFGAWVNNEDTHRHDVGGEGC